MLPVDVHAVLDFRSKDFTKSERASCEGGMALRRGPKKGGRGVGVLPRVTVRMPVLGRTRMIWGQASVVAGDPVKRVRERLAVLKGIVMSDVQGVSTPAEFPDRHPTKGD